MGSDGGRDIRGTERVAASGRRRGTEREWRFQIKRWREIGPTELRAIVNEAVPDPKNAPYAVVAVVAANVSSAGYDAFHEEAAGLGVRRHEIWDRATLNDLLLQPANADLRAFYFGDGHAIDGTVQIPLGLDASPGRDAPLIGRDDEAARVRGGRGDLILTGVPGTGKTRLVLEAGDVRFLNHEASTDDIADSIRRHGPRYVAIDDAGLDIGRLRTLLELRRASYDFLIIATVWPDDVNEVRRWLPDAALIDVGLLERKPMDEVLKALGITNYYLRAEILEQAKGRPGWAVALAELAKRERSLDVISGRGLINQVEPYLRRLGASSTEALGLLSVMAAIGPVEAAEMGSIDDFLRIDRLQRHRLVRDAASGGLLESERQALRVAPDPLRFALVAHWFYEQPGAWPIDQVVDAWPSHRDETLTAVLNAAAMGSAAARAHFEQLAPDLTELPEAILERYTALDPAAAQRAVAETVALGAHDRRRYAVLAVAARRFAQPEAVRGLLESAIGDDRPEHSNPDHPVRLVGEIGRHIDPHGNTSFEARRPLLSVATGWFDEAPVSERGLVWAKLVVHLLDPRAEGNYPDLGSPSNIQMLSGYEAPERLQTIVSDLWPAVEARLTRLDATALVALVDLVDQWVRVGRGFEGAFGVKPPPETIAIARPFSSLMMHAVAAASVGKPAAQTALQDTARLLNVRLRQKIDPEFRFLTWQPWRLPRRGQSRRLTAVAGKFADCWAGQDPDGLMARIAQHADEARRRGHDLAPMIHMAMAALAERVADVDAFIDAGMRSGRTYELRALLRASTAGSTEVPAWFGRALELPLRSEALMVTLAPDASPNAAEHAVDALTASDLFIVEEAMMDRARGEADWVSRALLHHPIPAVRGVASLWFALEPADHAVALPAEWYPEWAEAFVDSPLAAVRRSDNHRLGEQLRCLVDRDPDLVERWLTARLAESVFGTLNELPVRAESCLRALPREHRDRLMRRFGGDAGAAVLLAHLLGDDDSGWIAQLIDDNVIEPGDVLHALTQHDDPDDVRARRTAGLAPVLMARGVQPASVARTTMFGTWMGNQSSRFEGLRAAFEALEPARDSEGQAVREAAIELFATLRDQALEEERQDRIAGRL